MFPSGPLLEMKWDNANKNLGSLYNLFPCQKKNAEGPGKIGSRSFTFYIFSDGSHTHTLPREGAKFKVRAMRWKWNWKEMKVRWRWKWDESYLTRTRRGERNRRGKEQTPTHKNLAQSGQTLKGQGKRKAEADGRRTRPAEGGGRTEAPKPTYHSETYAYLSTRRTQPTCREENTWNRGPMGDQLMKWCIHMKCNCRDKAQGPRYSSQPHGQLTSSTLELRAHLNLTRVTKRKSL